MFHLKQSLRGEHGAVATIFAIVFGAGVFIFLLALTVDVGRIYAERRIVQNSADAASRAGALNCALGQCNDVTIVKLSPFANGNSPDNATQITYLCVHPKGAPSCAPVTNKLLDCNAIPSDYQRYVRLYAQSQSPSGQTSLIPALANALSGDPNAGTTVTSCSQVAWGTAATAQVAFPLALPPCGYKEKTDQIFRELPSVNSNETRWADCNTADTEGTVVTFPRAPQGFVQVTLPGIANCSTAYPVSIGQVLAINTANDVQLCGQGNTVASLTNFLNNPQYLPIVDKGTSNTVTVRFFVKFKLKAFWFGNKGYPDVQPYSSGVWWASQNPPCTRDAGKDCLYGSFEPTVLPDSGIDPNAPAMGAQAIQPLP